MSLLHLPATTSTMDIAAQLIREGDEATTIVIADVQTAGRGRQSRPWTTFPAPFSLAATFIFHVPTGPHVSLLAALALHEALGPVPGLTIKWPNDLLLSGRKVAGILCETLNNGKTTLIGIGVNLIPPPELPTQFTGTFLAQAGVPMPMPTQLAEHIHTCLTGLLTLYTQQGWSALHNNYLRHCATIGQAVSWNPAGKQKLTGIARGLTDSGHLELESEDGTTHVLHSGEIIETIQ